MVDRYDLYGRDDQGYRYDALQKQDPDGEWVDYDDYAALEQRIKELEEEIALLQGEVEAYQRSGDFKLDDDTAENKRLRSENERLQARLTEQADEYGKLIQSLHADVADWHKLADFRAAEIVRLREAAQLKRNTILDNFEDTKQCVKLKGRWIAVPESDFMNLRKVLAGGAE